MNQSSFSTAFCAVLDRLGRRSSKCNNNTATSSSGFATVRRRTFTSTSPRRTGIITSIDWIVPKPVTSLRALLPSPLPSIHISNDRHSARLKKHTNRCVPSRIRSGIRRPRPWRFCGFCAETWEHVPRFGFSQQGGLLHYTHLGRYWLWAPVRLLATALCKRFHPSPLTAELRLECSS